MDNASYAHHSALMSERRLAVTLALLAWWADPRPKSRNELIRRVHAVTEMKYAGTIDDGLDRAARAAHDWAEDGECGCGRPRCAAIGVPLPGGAKWSPVKRLLPSEVPHVDAPVPTWVGPIAADLIDPAPIYTGDFLAPTVADLFRTTGRRRSQALDRATVAALRWGALTDEGTTRPGQLGADDCRADLDRFLDARPVKGLVHAHRWLDVGQYAHFTARRLPPTPFRLVGLSAGAVVVSWWEAPEPTVVHGIEGRAVAVISSELDLRYRGPTLAARLEAAAAAGVERYGDEFIAAVGVHHLGAQLRTRDGQCSEVRGPAEPWIAGGW